MKIYMIVIHSLIGIILISIGIYLQIDSNEVAIYVDNNHLNLNLMEVDTYYDNISSLEYINSLWAWPADSNYYISNPYNYSHYAIDIVPNNGNYEIYSAYDGIVITNSTRSEEGNYLVIKQTNGYYILYAHLSKPLVSTGDTVKKGQLIGIMGRTGNATGIHLHFSVWDNYPHTSNSNPVNPLTFY